MVVAMKSALGAKTPNGIHIGTEMVGGAMFRESGKPDNTTST